MRTLRMPSRRVLALVALVAVSLVLTGLGTAACFSERTTAAPLLSGQCVVPASADVAGSTVVFIKGFAFQPATVQIRAGTRVTWVNCETTAGLAHTTTDNAGSWDSGVFEPGSAFTHTFAQAGTFNYKCTVHPFMLGSVTVE